MVSDHHHTLYKGEFKSTAGGHFSQARAGHSSLAPKATDEIAEFLAERRLIQPVVTQTRVTAQTGGKIFYDTVNTLGNSGGPLLNAQGRVVAINEAINSDFPGLNLALPLKSAARRN